MAFFEVLKTITETNVIERRQARDKNGNVSVVESIRVVNIKPAAYGHEDIKPGDVLEIKGHLALKAAANTEYFKEVQKEKPKKKE